jgi:hypothetical protein
MALSLNSNSFRSKVLHRGGDLPPDVKRNQLRDAATRKQQDFAHLQCINSQRFEAPMQTFKRTITDEVESRLCNLSARGSIKSGSGSMR